MPYSEQLREEIIKAQDDFVWESHAWEFYERGARWYLAMSVVAVVFVVYAVATSNFLFAFFILLTAFILVLSGHKEPHRMLVQIGPNGVVVDGRLYEYKDIHKFAIVYHPPETKLLYVYTNSVLAPRIRISLEDEDPVSLRDYLTHYLEENLHLQEEHLSDILARILRL
ncbi:MAG: hypothetical protein NUV54_02745 [Candidatus Taylorbacteria bacterium]|nr:hypothetical protein [Candidatus Taylorbacteria bacterium]